MMPSEKLPSSTGRPGSDSISRRQLLGGAGAAAVPLVTGCLGDDEKIEHGRYDILVENEDNREHTISVEVTNVKDGQRDNTTPHPENIVWERDFTVSLLPGEQTIERDIFDGSNWYYVRVGLADSKSFGDWHSGCFYRITVSSDSTLGRSWEYDC
jgi:hypothetical protein